MAIVSGALLLSGGMDSSAIAWWSRPEFAIFVDYGQKPASAERRAAEAVAGATGAAFHAIAVDCAALGSGLMAGAPSLPEAPNPEWWPFRNQLLVTFAAAVAIRLGARRLLIGTVAEDGANGDGSPEFVQTLSGLLAMQEGGLELIAPAIDLSSVELVERSGIPPEILTWSHSCCVSDVPCLRCRGCLKHLAVLDRTGRRRPVTEEVPAPDPEPQKALDRGRLNLSR